MRNLFLIFLLNIAITTRSQTIHYNYDASGNRVSRETFGHLIFESQNQHKQVLSKEGFSLLRINLESEVFNYDGMSITIFNNSASDRTLSVYTLSGQMIYSKQQMKHATAMIDVSGFAGSVVIIEIQDGKETPKSYKLVLNK